MAGARAGDYHGHNIRARAGAAQRRVKRYHCARTIPLLRQHIRRGGNTSLIFKAAALRKTRSSHAIIINTRCAREHFIAITPSSSIRTDIARTFSIHYIIPLRAAEKYHY